jgi:DNA-directed RNA polymerase subunit RPC12/RpoP
VTKYTFKCSECKKAFTSQKALDQHIKSKHSENGHEWKENLDNSDNTTSNETDKIKCPYCGKLRSKKGLKAHITDVHEIPCPYCSERVITKNSLLKHLEGSHKERIFISYVCHLCKKVFKTEDALFQHMRLKGFHIKSRESYECPQCDGEFLSKGLYLDHLIQTKHNLIQQPNWDDIYPCPLCDRDFTSENSLSQHISVKHKESMKEIRIYKKGIAVFEKPTIKSQTQNLVKKIAPKSIPDRKFVVMDETVGMDQSVIEALEGRYDVRYLPEKLLDKTPLEVCLACKEYSYGLISKEYDTVMRAQDMKINLIFLLSERGKHRDLIRISKRNYSIS